MTGGAVPHTTTNGFLFADLRGYSAFVEAHGDLRASELLARYRAIVRDVVSRHEGAEVRTEGDSFYVVFPSASRAVVCGMDLLVATSQAELPVGVGIGVHAGETADTGEGPVGSAVNIAARVCAAAAPGELLVTDTVRALTRTLVPYRFVPRGTPPLKGITEPIALFRVESASDPGAQEPGPASLQPPVSSRRAPIPAVVVVALVAIVTLGTALLVRQASDPLSSSPVVARPPGDPSAGGLTAIERDLVSRIAGLPPEVRERCRTGTIDERANGAVASITCPLPSDLPAASAHYDLFDQPAVMLTSFDAYRHAHGDPTTGCRQAPLGYEAWSVQRISQGHVLCFPEGGGSRILWTYEGGDGAGVMGSATRDDGSWQSLYQWWDEIHPLMAH